MKNFFKVALATLVLVLTGCSDINGPSTVSDDRLVTLPAAPTLAQRIHAGHYEYVNETVLSNFRVEPITADYEIRLVVVHLNRIIGTPRVLLELEARGLRPANTAECLAYGAKLSADMRASDLRPPTYWLVCLGSTATSDGERRVLALGESNDNWVVSDFYLWGRHWFSDYRFLAVRK
jgi:hypothetical protein